MSLSGDFSGDRGSGNLSNGGARVVVAVNDDISCKDAIRWAVVHKIKGREDKLILLHIVLKIMSASKQEMNQSDVSNTVYAHHMRTVVQPMMLSLRKLVDNKVQVELRVGRSNFKEKGILEETLKLSGTVLVLGTPTRGRFSMKKGSTTGSSLVRHRPLGLSVYVIQKDKVVDFGEPGEQFADHHSSFGSGSMLTSVLSDLTRRGRKSTGSSGHLSSHHSRNSGDGGTPDQDRSRENGLPPSFIPTSSLSDGHPAHSRSSPFPRIDGHWSSESDFSLTSPPTSKAMNRVESEPIGIFSDRDGLNSSGRGDMATSTAVSALTGSLSKSGSRGSSGSMHNLPSRAPSTKRFAEDSREAFRFSYGRQHSQHQPVSPSRAPLSGPRSAASAELPTTRNDAPIPSAGSSSGSEGAKEFDSHTMDHLAALEARLRDARAVLDDFPEPVGAAHGIHLLHKPELDLPEPPRMSAGVYAGGGPEAELRRELEMMKRKAAEAERARVQAEFNTQRRLQDADRSLRLAEEENRRKDIENAAKVERATLSATLALEQADQLRKVAEVEALKSQQALAQAAKTREQLKQEARLRLDAEEKARSMRSYRQYTWQEIQDATNNLDINRKIGEGGFGTVFQGTLHHTPVAVKVLKNTNAMQAAHEFKQEVEVLGQIQHPHMVMLLGCCPEQYSLVYEFCSNGSLEDRLLCLNGTPPLPWYVRCRVAAEIASALLVLHKRPVPIVHRDLKPANILLDKNFTAKLGDVGLAKIMPGLSSDHTYMRESVPVGTFAYVDPEFQRTGEFGPKSDVYALGIVLLDLLTGRKPHVYEQIEDAVIARDYAQVMELLDTTAGNWPTDAVMALATLGVRCAEMKRRKRPDLDTEVMSTLEEVRSIAAAAEEEESSHRQKAPNSLLCPITQEVMVNPVLAADGHTYEEEAIEEWLEANETSPMTNMVLQHKHLVPNHAVRSLIRDWQERHFRFSSQ